MSDIKVNGNTYNDVTSVKLLKADESGYAEYKEGATTIEDVWAMFEGNDPVNIGDYTSDNPAPNLGWLGNKLGGTVSYPHATSAKGGIGSAIYENILLPNVVSITSAQSVTGQFSAFSMGYTQVSGIVDLRSLTTIQNSNQVFPYAEFGTLKLGGITGANNNWMQKATITNLVWYGLTESLLNTSYTKGGLQNTTAVTNLYVPAALVETVQVWITDGSLTKVTNVYSIDDWED